MAYAVVAAKGFEDFSPWASEYQAAAALRRLLSERDRLIAEGANPADLLVPDAPSEPHA